jgi:hypothetical protein
VLKLKRRPWLSRAESLFHFEHTSCMRLSARTCACVRACVRVFVRACVCVRQFSTRTSATKHLEGRLEGTWARLSLAPLPLLPEA